jgi:VIT1/CCC1 family predicted Fe2+/Mn2+ transporter
MTERPRDWDKELADIDRVIEKQGATAPPGAPPALPSGGTTSPTPRAPAPAEPVVARGSVALTWFWMALAVLLAAALPLWPYGKGCGLQLFFYLGAAALALLAGATGAINSWRSRRGPAHVISLLVVVFAGVMAAREVLPRIGYAVQSETWFCPSVPEPAPPPSTAPSPNGA